MTKYIYQRTVICICILSLFIIIGGFFIPGFYKTKYTNCKVIQNIQARHNSAEPNIACNDLGRYVKLSYTDNNGIRHEIINFWHYNNRIDKSCKKSYYDLIERHEYKKFNNLTIILFVIFGLSLLLILFTCLDEMDVKYDYCNSDSKDITIFRIKVFCWWKKFTEHPAEIVNEYREKTLSEINGIKYKYFDRHTTPYYREIQKDYEEFVAEQQK